MAPQKIIEDVASLLTVFSPSNLPLIQNFNEAFDRIKPAFDKWEEEVKQLVKLLRELADQLEEHHGNVLIADRVGTGVGIAGGVLTIAGLIAAPFTAGISLVLTIGGAATCGSGTLVSLGSNVADMVINKIKLADIEKKCKELQDSTEELGRLSTCFQEAHQKLLHVRSILDRLATRSNGDIEEMLQQAIEAITNLPKESADDVEKLVEKLSEVSVDWLSTAVASLSVNINSIKQCCNALALIRNSPKFGELTTRSTLPSVKGPNAEMAKDGGAIAAAVKGTPLAMSTAARAASGFFAAVQITVNVLYMVKICTETKTTPTVTTLREMADQLEREIQQTASEEQEKKDS